MRTIDDPLVHDVPDLIGRFVVIAIDPAASLALLDDETALLEASQLLPGRYLALVKGNLHFEWSEARGGPKLTLQFSLAGHGLPAMNSWAAVPISPAQPTGDCARSALHPIPPMPFNNCSIDTLHQVSGNVSRVHGADFQGPHLSEDDEAYAFTAAYEDERAFGLAERARRAHRPAPVKHDGPARPASSANAHYSDQKDEGNIQVNALIDELFQGDDTPRMKPHFQMWFDISQFEVEQLGQPAGIYAELAQLKRIEREWAQRTVSAIMSKEPETNAWLSGLGDAEPPQLIDGYEAGNEDALIMPEDAIEHRIERSLIPGVEKLPLGSERIDLHRTPILDDAASSGAGPCDRVGSSNVSTGSQNTPRSRSSSNASGIAHNGIGGLSVFRAVLSSILSCISRLGSFIWRLVWFKPFFRH